MSTTAPATGLDPLALAQAATQAAGGRPVLEVALELAGAARTIGELLERLEGCARFVATVEAVDLEESSTRLIVTVRARDQEPEQLRTDRTDTAWGEVMAARARRHLGQRVLVHKLLEEAGTDRKVRVLVWLDPLTDAGADTVPAMPPASPPPDAGASEPPAPPAPAPAAADRAYDRADQQRASDAEQILRVIDEAGIPSEHIDALLEIKYAGATAVEALPDQQFRALHHLVLTDAGVQRLRTAAAEAHAARSLARCSGCGQPSEALSGAGECPACDVPF